MHTKFHGLQTDNQLNWKNRINQISKCACNACVHLLCLIHAHVCVCVCVCVYVDHFLMQPRLQMDCSKAVE